VAANLNVTYIKGFGLQKRIKDFLQQWPTS
jgi:hypothetical protein